MDLTGEKLIDTRLIERNIAKGLISREEYDAHVAALPDRAESSSKIAAKIAAIGVRRVLAKDTGENE